MLVPRVVMVSEGAEASSRLQELGLEPQELIDAVQAAEIERRSCSPFEPSASPGFKAWVAAFRSLAEAKSRQGWVKTETLGLPRILNPDTSIAIAVVTGDDGTGRRHCQPKSRSTRGSQSVLLVRSNEIQLTLDFGDSRFRRMPLEHEQITWWLLIYSEGEQVRAELSLPVGLEDQRLAVWEERIIIDLPDLALPSRRREDEEPPLSIEIPVRLRSNA